MTDSNRPAIGKCEHDIDRHKCGECGPLDLAACRDALATAYDRVLLERDLLAAQGNAKDQCLAARDNQIAQLEGEIERLRSLLDTKDQQKTEGVGMSEPFPSKEQAAMMLKDIERLESLYVAGDAWDDSARDVCCHARALLQQVEVLQRDNRHLGDALMFVRRLMRFSLGTEVHQQAMDWMGRNGLHGSPLKERIEEV